MLCPAESGCKLLSTWPYTCPGGISSTQDNYDCNSDGFIDMSEYNCQATTTTTSGGSLSCPSGQSNPYSTCSGSNCVSISGCGVSNCTDSSECIGSGGYVCSANSCNYSASGWRTQAQCISICTTTTTRPVINYDYTVNFGIQNAVSTNPWIQTTGGDLRLEGWGEGIGGYNYNVPNPNPPDSVKCGDVPTYASVIGSGGSPGIIFTGNASYSFCNGSVCQERSSVNQWVVGGTTYPESYGSGGGSNLKTSYAFVSSKISAAGIAPTRISSLDDITQNGVYIVQNEDGTAADLNTPASQYTFGNNKNYVILVTGNLNINGKILVPLGSRSTAAFVVKGDIVVDSSVGEVDCNSSTADIEGLYSADGSFKMLLPGGLNDCLSGGGDRRLNIGGNIVINASLEGGTFQSDRNLCSNNATCPILSVSERPDFILNAPEILKSTNYIWQEQAP
jgi:hypothetical protein